MNAKVKKILVPLFLALTFFAGGLALNLWGGATMAILRVRAAEILMVHPSGPRLGRRAVREDLVLIMFDTRTATELGYVRSFADDQAVYRRLIEAGASVVYDTRSCAAATEQDFAELQPLLDQMLALTLPDDTTSTATDLNNSKSDSSDREAAKPGNSKRSHVLREIYLSRQLTGSGIDKYTDLAAANPLNRFPHVFPFARVRLYPIAYLDSLGTAESAPIAIARRYWGLPRVSSEELVRRLSESGIMTEWHRQYPNEIQASSDPPRPYSLGTLQLPWLAFLSNSILVVPAGFWVRYDVNCLDYNRLSYLDIMRGEEIATSELKGKIAIVGYSLAVDPGSEIYEVPSGSGKASAAEMIALATQTVLDGKSMLPFPFWFEISLAAALCLVMAWLTTRLRPLEGLASSVGVLLVYFIGLIIAYRFGRLGDFAIAPLAAALTSIVSGTFNSWRSHRTQVRVIDMFGRYLPRAVVQQLMLKPELESLQLGGTEREITVLFADIRGFTTFAEKLPAKQVVLELNRLLAEMVECTFEHEGTLDKFIGDAILVLFNAPLDQTDHVTRAVHAALDMQRRLGEQAGPLSVGIGIHVGNAIVGNIGTPQRMEYTAIGNTVNTASRLCDHAQGGSVIVSQSVADRLDDQFELMHRDPIQVKGLSESISIWSVKVF